MIKLFGKVGGIMKLLEMEQIGCSIKSKNIDGKMN